MKKLFVAVAAVLCTAAMALTASATDVIINGNKVPFDQSSGYPFISAEGRTLVPLRATMEAYGAKVSWDAEQRTAIVTKGVTTVTCTIDESCIYRNGTKIANDATAVIVDGRTYLPIRAVLEALDAEVGWDGNVIVTTPGFSNIVYEIENSGGRVSNIWAEWNAALALKQAGNYAGCVEKMKNLAPNFLRANDDHSDAMLFNHMGECFNKLGMKAEASACYMRESEKWVTAGLPEAAKDAARRANYSSSVVQIFATTNDKSYAGGKYFGVNYEPLSGTYIGVTLKGSSAYYMEQFPQKVGKDMAGYLLYGNIGTPLSTFKGAVEEAKNRNKIIQYALQPNGLSDFMSITPDDYRYITLAQDMEASGAKFLIRFACEMNDDSSHWYTTDYNLYIEKYRYVSDIFHTYAPSCAMVWSPNFYPAENMEYYYPGDKYVDYVGISAYAEHQPETDPLKMGIDRSRFAEMLDKIVSLYGYKKPIIISECGSSYRDIHTGKDITAFASRQIKDFFTYLPIKYPQVKAAFLFETADVNGIREFELTNSEYAQAFIQSISSPMYLSSIDSQTQDIPCSFEIGNNVTVPASLVNIHSFVKTTENDFAYVVYRINGVDVGAAYGIPYTVGVDFSPYSGQTVKLSCLAFDSTGSMCADKTYNVKVN